MHIIYTTLGVLIVGWYQNFGLITGDVIMDLVFLFPVLILSHLIDLIPSGVPRSKDTLKFMAYSSIVSLAICISFAVLMNINFVTIFLSALFVGWFDYLLWISRFLKNKGKMFSKINEKLNSINIVILHPHIIKNNGNFLGSFRHNEYEEELDGKKYRAFSQEKIWIFKEIFILLLLLSIDSLSDIKGSLSILVMVVLVIFGEEIFKKLNK